MNRPLLPFCLLVLVAADWSISSADQNLNLKAKDVVAQEERLGESLDNVDREIASLVVELNKTQSLRRQQLNTVSDMDQQLRLLDGKMKRLRERIEQRLRSRARMNLTEIAWRRMLLTNLGSNRVLRTRGYVDSILKNDLTLMRRLSDEVVNIGKLKGEKAEALAALRGIEKQLAQRRAALEEERAVKNEVIRIIQSEMRLLRALNKTRTRQRAALTIKRGSGGLGLGALKGKLPMPAKGPIAIPYGPRRDLKMKTTVFSNGWSIDASPGSPVRVVFDGEVVFSGWYAGFGNLVIVDHGAGHHTLYAHLQTIHKARGEEVRQGDLLGEVGDTGSLRGPHLYFELRIRKRPVNPRYWIGGNRIKP